MKSAIVVFPFRSTERIFCALSSSSDDEIKSRNSSRFFSADPDFFATVFFVFVVMIASVLFHSDYIAYSLFSQLSFFSDCGCWLLVEWYVQDCPDRRFARFQDTRLFLRSKAGAEPFNGGAGFDVIAARRTVEHCNRYLAENHFPFLPEMDLTHIVCSHQPDELRVREVFFKCWERVGGVLCM